MNLGEKVSFEQSTAAETQKTLICTHSIETIPVNRVVSAPKIEHRRRWVQDRCT